MAGVNKRERVLAEEVRKIELDLIKKYLEDTSDENKQFRKELILKLATNILPRKTEIGGDEDGLPIKIMFDKAFKNRDA